MKNEVNEWVKLSKQSFSLEGSFWDKQIDYCVYPVMGSKKVVVNIHGTFWNKSGTNGKYDTFAENLQGNGISAVIYWSSRKSQIDEAITDNYERKKASFEGKTFQDELTDAREALRHTIDNAQELVWVAPDELEITLNGNSLWGIFAFYLAKEFPQVKAISTVWTGLRLEKADVLILSTLPDADELRDVISYFSGRYTMHQALRDETFSPETYDELYNAVSSEEKNRVQYTGVNHSFRKIWDTDSTKPYEKVLQRVKALVAEEKLVNRTIDLESEIWQVREVVSEDLKSILIPHSDGDEINYVW